MIHIISGIVIFYIGIGIGFILRKWLVDRRNFDGVITIEKEDNKIIYSLELHDDPLTLEFMNEAIFKVVRSEENPVRN